jgi:hypothetical protein
MKEDNLSNVRPEASRHFRKKKMEYWKDNINELESNSKYKIIRDLCRGINEFKKGYRPRTNLAKDEDFYLFANHNIVNRWMNCFCQILNVQVLGGQKYRQQRHLCQSLASPRLRLLLESWKVSVATC